MDLWRDPVVLDFLQETSDDELGNVLKGWNCINSKYERIVQFYKLIPEIPSIIIQFVEGSNLQQFLKQQSKPIDWNLRNGIDVKRDVDVEIELSTDIVLPWLSVANHVINVTME